MDFKTTKKQFRKLKSRISKSVKTQLKKKNKMKRLKEFSAKRSKRINNYFEKDLSYY